MYQSTTTVNYSHHYLYASAKTKKYDRNALSYLSFLSKQCTSRPLPFLPLLYMSPYHFGPGYERGRTESSLKYTYYSRICANIAVIFKETEMYDRNFFKL